MSVQDKTSFVKFSSFHLLYFDVRINEVDSITSDS
jgi:hypothetical protein